MKAKQIIYINFALIALLIFMTIYQYNRIADFESQLGYNFQRTVKDTQFLLEHDGDPNIWVKTLQEKNGEFTLASHIGELTRLSRQYHMMNGKISMIGVMLDSLADDYHQIAVNIGNDVDYSNNKEEINRKKDFLIPLLNNIDSISGENERQYYKEFTDSESKTSNLVWREYKKYERED
ncbi:hypothetical protein [Mesobacillus jeotgali]|uniref:hypothetical protein n=2 Tax=Mesobacillus jeotgali TaxID=129985 RepID=UPI001CFF4083|nr:hypothetical protein [Mesobacillus jeotgali]